MHLILDGGERRSAAGRRPMSYSDFEYVLKDIHHMMSACFGRAEPRLRALHYMLGLSGIMGDVAGTRRNVVAAPGTTDGAQRLLTTARWDEVAVRQKLVDLVLRNAGPGGDLYIIEASFAKKGRTAVATERQYSTDAGRITACQNAVLMFYGAVDGCLFLVDADLYLPSTWTDDQERRDQAKLPWHMGYRSKSRIARDMVDRAVAAGLQPGWVSLSLLCSDKSELLRWMQHRAVQYLATLTAGEFRDLSVPRPVVSGMAVTDRAVPCQVRPHLTEYYRACSRRPVAGDELGRMIEDMRTMHYRWQSLRQQIGIGRYEVRSWRGWQRHMILAMAVQIAHQLAGHQVVAAGSR
jgi:SRSO17 transposase